MTSSNRGGNFLFTLPIVDGKNYDHWVVRMEVILGFQEILEIMKDGISDKDEAANYKKDYTARCRLRQCVDLVNFEKISKANSTKEAWDILHKAYRC
uniref:DUF4219 domain-containing protein n=1 Tax=Cajanus cajan TaxID=3821 RepID=A0A151U311_CAJCA|nr:hypothetical protein KK1_006308 [Cajanus cajan]